MISIIVDDVLLSGFQLAWSQQKRSAVGNSMGLQRPQQDADRMQLFIAKWFKSSPTSKGQELAFCRLIVVHPPMGCGVRMFAAVNKGALPCLRLSYPETNI